MWQSSLSYLHGWLDNWNKTNEIAGMKFCFDSVFFVCLTRVYLIIFHSNKISLNTYIFRKHWTKMKYSLYLILFNKIIWNLYVYLKIIWITKDFHWLHDAKRCSNDCPFATNKCGTRLFFVFSASHTDEVSSRYIHVRRNTLMNWLPVNDAIAVTRIHIHRPYCACRTTVAKTTARVSRGKEEECYQVSFMDGKI